LTLILTVIVLEYARWIEQIAPGFIAMIILAERGEDYRDRDLLDQVTCLIEIFGVAGAAQIVGCPQLSAARSSALVDAAGSRRRV
jgi:hypothetical protein